MNGIRAQSLNAHSSEFKTKDFVFHKLAETDEPTCGRCCIGAALCSAPSYRWLLGGAPLAAGGPPSGKVRLDLETQVLD